MKEPKGKPAAAEATASLRAARALTAAAFDAWLSIEARPDNHETVGRGAGGNATSRADSVLEQAILEAAKPFGLTVLSEEAGLVRGDGPLLAVVDPLDGSRNAGRGIPFHCASVAVGPVQGRLADLEAGVVQNLVTGDLYEAVRGGGATLNGQPIKPRPFDAKELVLGTIADYADLEIEEAHRRPGRHIRDLGAAALEMCLVGTGALDAFHVRKPWLRVIDIAAATLIVREAGGQVLDPASGRDLDMPLNLEVRSGILATHSAGARKAILGSVTPKGTAAHPASSGASGPLTWALVAKAGIPHVRAEALRLRDLLVARGQTVLQETDLAKATGAKRHTLAELDQAADLFLTVGGDGTILMTQAVTDKPVFGVNAGAIGFLAEVEPAQAEAALDQIVRGDYRIEERDKLSAWLDGKPLVDATNEVTIQTSRIAKLIRFRITVSGEVLDTLRGDGLIISTATGSTGYAMSVGGPLVHPLVHGTVLAPIAPFRLSARPWVVPFESVIEVTLEDRESQSGTGQARVVVDGQHGFDIEPGQTVRVGPALRKARFIRLGAGFYERVRSKLTR
ncbi:MAG: inositol monophosphatase family protein [Candidatus Thermoplasmatota archaeon]